MAYIDRGLVSIVTPVHNCESYIESTINSVLSQTYENWELILIDDCSVDKSAEIIQKYSDDRIKYHRLNKNSGAAIARNTAIRLAKGKWIAFLDSDDLWDSNKLETQIEFMVSHNYDFSYTKYRTIDQNGNPLGIEIFGPKVVTHNLLLCYNWLGCLTVVYNREKTGLIQIPDIRKRNDWALWIKISEKADCHLLDRTLASYRHTQNSLSSGGAFKLIKYHQAFYKTIVGSNSLSAIVLTLNNLFWGVIKKSFFKRAIAES